MKLFHYSRVKRVIDAVSAAVLLLLLAPILLACATAVRVCLGKPVLFRQVRPGRHGVPFELIKFRTMSQDVGPDGARLSDNLRLGAFGRFLRASSLDELPELWNVLKGDMSFVGPRPLLMEYLLLYDAEQRRRHEVRPGITGWAQVNGRNALSWEERFRLDVWYVDHQSFVLDLKILLMTVKCVCMRDGITQPGQATVEYFRGNES